MRSPVGEMSKRRQGTRRIFRGVTAAPKSIQVGVSAIGSRRFKRFGQIRAKQKDLNSCYKKRINFELSPKVDPLTI